MASHPGRRRSIKESSPWRCSDQSPRQEEKLKRDQSMEVLILGSQAGYFCNLATAELYLYPSAISPQVLAGDIHTR